MSQVFLCVLSRIIASIGSEMKGKHSNVQMQINKDKDVTEFGIA